MVWILIALCVVVVALFVWMGFIQRKVSDHSWQIRDNTKELEKHIKTTDQLDRVLSAVATAVQEGRAK